MPITNGTTLAKYPVLQQTGVCPAISDTAVHAAITLPTTGTTVVTTEITNPTRYRGLSIKGNQITCASKAVIVAGTDWLDRPISETITNNADGTTTTNGAKAFKTVTSITVPTRGAASDTISVGISELLGLYRAIAASADLITTGRKASAATSFTLETNGTVNTGNGTIIPSATITADDQFEFAYLSISQ